MKKISTAFLQVVLLLIAIITLAILIWFPLTEGRAPNLDLLSIYADPLILYVYAASSAFFITLYKGIRLLGYVGQNQVFSPESVSALRSIRYCAISLAIMIVGAAIFVSITHPKDDDAAGFLSLCIISTFLTIVMATAVAIFEKILQNALNLKSENDLTI